MQFFQQVKTVVHFGDYCQQLFNIHLSIYAGCRICGFMTDQMGDMYPLNIFMSQLGNHIMSETVKCFLGISRNLFSVELVVKVGQIPGVVVLRAVVHAGKKQPNLFGIIQLLISGIPFQLGKNWMFP